MSLHSIKLITFDATNTLLKFRIPPWQYYTVIAQNYGFVGTEDDVKIKLSDNIKDMWRKYPNYGKSSITYEKWWSEVVKKTLEDHIPVTTNLDVIASKLIDEYKTSKCWCVAEGGHELLDLIKRSFNVQIGVISNFDPRLNDIFKNLDLDYKFHFILNSYDVGYSKPDKEIFTSAIKMSKKDIKPYEALHIGDDLEKDYKGAKAAGWHAILVNPDETNLPPNSPCVFKSLKDVCTAIKLNQIAL
ncbi:unnamed protein product [Arctia plantaginis]|uniref:Uncharacterized protein n=1 Tax=Arctia plantaginis TaxID=874455 RepID=A0A8S0Z1K7_ARCPL|nr:unnamed protein product [Arctia plantaginis]